MKQNKIIIALIIIVVIASAIFYQQGKDFLQNKTTATSSPITFIQHTDLEKKLILIEHNVEKSLKLKRELDKINIEMEYKIQEYENQINLTAQIEGAWDVYYSIAKSEGLIEEEKLEGFYE